MSSEFPEISASSWLIYDSNFQVVVASKRDIAQITKIVTFTTALRIWDQLGLDLYQSTFDISRESQISIGTLAGLKEAMKIKVLQSVYDLLFAMILPSGNDAAYAIAENTGALLKLSTQGKNPLQHGVKVFNLLDLSVAFRLESYNLFISEMNTTCRLIGMNNSVFVNVGGGSDKKQFVYLFQFSFQSFPKSTCQDLQLLASYATQQAFIAEVVKKSEHACQVEYECQTVSMKWHNINDLVLEDGYCGIKPGYNRTAGETYLGWYKKDNIELIIVLLNCKDCQSRYDETKALVQWFKQQHPTSNQPDWKQQRFLKDTPYDQKQLLKPDSIDMVSLERSLQSTVDSFNSLKLKIDQSQTSNLIQYIDQKTLTAKSWLLYDRNLKKVAGTFNELEKRQIASTTKVMNFVTAIRLWEELEFDVYTSTFKVSKDAAQQHGSTANIKENMIFSVYDLLHGMMLPSGNDAAYCIAENTGALINQKRSGLFKKPPTIDAMTFYENNQEELSQGLLTFLAEMNVTAKQLNLQNSHFSSPNGLTDPNNYGTAYDLYVLADYAIENQLIKDIIHQQTYQCEALLDDSVVFMSWVNTNELLKEAGYRGVKTGTTDLAGCCLISWYNLKDIDIIVVVLGAAKDLDRFTETKIIVQEYLKQRKNNQFWPQKSQPERKFNVQASDEYLKLQDNLKQLQKYVATEKSSIQDIRIVQKWIKLEVQVDVPKITPLSWLLYDKKKQSTIVSKDILLRREIASLTKMINIATAMRIWDFFGMDLTSIFEVSEKASKVEGSTANLKKGMKVEAYEILYALMLPSGNDASYCIAENTGAILLLFQQGLSPLIENVKAFNCLDLTDSQRDQAYKLFIGEMNNTCKILGMDNSHFENSSGLSNKNQYCCSQDLLTLANYIIDIPLVKNVFGTKTFTGTVYLNGEKVLLKWENTNALLGVEGYKGLKTGITPNAGPTFVAYYEKDDQELVVVTLASKSFDLMFIETQALIDWYIHQQV